MCQRRVKIDRISRKSASLLKAEEHMVLRIYERRTMREEGQQRNELSCVVNLNIRHVFQSSEFSSLTQERLTCFLSIQIPSVKHPARLTVSIFRFLIPQLNSATFVYPYSRIQVCLCVDFVNECDHLFRVT